MPSIDAPRRPVLRYHGGKWKIAPWVIAHFPPHRIYVEPYGGAASVLMQKPRTYSEVYNELDGEVVNVFRVLRSEETAKQLERLLFTTPFSREEFAEAYYPTDDAIERARRTIIKSFMGFGSNALHEKKPRGMRTRASVWRAPTGFRANSSRSGSTPAHDWQYYPVEIQTFVERLRGVVIEQRSALDIIRQHDRQDTLFYCDPPYVLSTRTDDIPDYRHEMSDDDHRALAERLHAVQGMVILSGYPSALYEELYGAWHQVHRKAMADGARERQEVLWINPAAARQLQPSLF
ncbi:MAG TPA: DNA adenine methylase [Armatimonadota bacterium]